MAEPKENLQMEKIVSLCKRRGFIFQSSEIYGGINGFWDYGPLGAELKRNVKELWWNTMTRQRDDVAGLEATIIMSPEIWKASGHVDTFADLMRECPLTKKRVRADQVKPQSGIAVSFAGVCRRSSNTQIYFRLIDEFSPTITSDDTLKQLLEKEIPDSKAIENLKEAFATKPEAFEELKASPQAFVELISSEKRGIISSQIGKDILFKRFCVLLQPGKPIESARKLAVSFYEALGFQNLILLGEQQSKIENSIDFHPESGVMLTEARPFNLMFKTYVGPVEDKDSVAYLRPETAQAIFAQFKNVLETSRQKVPFGIAQVGKAFRNEVTPRNFTFRSREFEQMELEFFIKPDEVIEAIHGSVSSRVCENADNPRSDETRLPQPNWGWEAWHKYWVEERVRFYEGIGLSRETLGFHHQTPAELAHYARACTDILFKFPFSKKDADGSVAGDELEGIAARSDFDLSQHARFSGKPMGVFDDELRVAWAKLPVAKQKDLLMRYQENRLNYLVKTGVPFDQAAKQATDDANGLAKGQYIPHVIEPSAGVDRLILALIANAYTEVTKTDDKGKSETTVVMKFHPRVAPVKVGVMPLLKNKPELVNKALAVRDLLRPWMNVFYDDGGSIGRRYARQDEAGTPFCVTIDFDTLGEKPELLDTVTIRYRDDGKQERLKISELLPFLLSKIR